MANVWKFVVTRKWRKDDLFRAGRGHGTVLSGRGISLSNVCQSCVFTSSQNGIDGRDFALDLCSVDLQQADRETESRKRVEQLIAQFAEMKTVQEHSEKTISATLPAQLGALRRQKSSFWTV